MNSITQEFEYPLPDEYLHTTDELKLTGKFLYEGPEKIWVFVDKDSGKLDFNSFYMIHDESNPAESENLATLKAGVHRTAILVDSKIDTVIASLFMFMDVNTLPQKEYKIENKVYYTRPDPTPTFETYDVDEIYYDFENNEWKKPLPWKKPHISAEEFNTARLSIIESVDSYISETENISEELKTELLAFKTELEDIPNKFKDCDPWTIPFPLDPRSKIVNTEPSE